MGILRFILALAVVLVHTDYVYDTNSYGIRLMGGVVAVQSFYIISGFYMALILSTRYVGAGAYRVFIGNRFLRIYPIYWVVLLFTVALSGFSSFTHMFGFRPQDYVGPETPLTAGAMAFLLPANVLLFGQDVTLFQGLEANRGLYFTPDFAASTPPVHDFMPVPQAWTLSLELMFYLIAPWLARRPTSILLALVMLSLALRLYLYFVADLDDDPWTYRFFPAELAFFIAGMVSYRLYLPLAKRWINRASATIAMLVVVGVTVGYHWLPGGAVKQWSYYALLFSVMPWLFVFSSSHRRLDNWLGELSYPVYVSHVFVLLALSPLLSETDPSIGTQLIVCVASVLFSVALMRLVSGPVERYRMRRLETLAGASDRLSLAPAAQDAWGTTR
jgi:peptidoglycan/LPS O-acetylase OafA/YrhL